MYFIIIKLEIFGCHCGHLVTSIQFQPAVLKSLSALQISCPQKQAILEQGKNSTRPPRQYKTWNNNMVYYIN